jgi:hypothetical protein
MKKMKSTSKNPPPAFDASTRQAIEYYKQNQMQQSPMPTDYVLLVKLTRELETHSSTPFTVSKKTLTT